MCVFGQGDVMNEASGVSVAGRGGKGDAGSTHIEAAWMDRVSFTVTTSSS